MSLFCAIFEIYSFIVYTSIRVLQESNVQFFDVKHTEVLKMEYHFISFNSFYKMSLDVIAHIIRIRDGLSNTELNVSLVKDKMFNRILEYENKPDNFNIEYDPDINLRVFKNLSVISCSIKEHQIEPAIFKAHSLQNNTLVKIPIYHFKSCGCIFIGKETFRIYEKEYGKLNITTVKDSIPSEFEQFAYLNGESKLHRAGYIVTDGKMSDSERRNLLKHLYETKQLSAFEITRDIENAIRIFHNRSEYNLALKKWKDDLLFFSEYIKNFLKD